MRFLRRGTGMHLRIGKKRKKMQTWRKPKGRDNKMRENRKGRFALVSIGYKRKNEKRNSFIVYNMEDLENAKKYSFIVLGKMGKKKKKEILKRAAEMKIDFHNINTRKFLKENESK